MCTTVIVYEWCKSVIMFTDENQYMVKTKLILDVSNEAKESMKLV